MKEGRKPDFSPGFGKNFGSLSAGRIQHLWSQTLAVGPAWCMPVPKSSIVSSSPGFVFKISHPSQTDLHVCI